MMTRNLQPFGNSLGVIFPKNVLDMIGADEKTTFSLDIQDGRLVLSPLSAEENRKRLRAVLDRSDKRYGRSYRKLAK